MAGRRYGGFSWPPRAERYVHIEVGHAVENICFDLGTTMVGAFNDAGVKEALAMPKEEDPLAIVPVGKATGQ